MSKLNYFIALFVVVLLSSCGSTFTVTSVGELSMVSTRNIDKSVKYEVLKTYAGISGVEIEAAIAASKGGVIKTKNPIVKEIRTYQAAKINQSVDNVVKSVAGGEYLYNAKFYLVAETKKSGATTSGSKAPTVFYSYVACGDVWGVKDPNANIKGYHVSDKVIFTYTKELRKMLGKNFDGEIGKQYSGKVIELKAAEAKIQLENGSVVDIPYTNLTNLGQN